MSTNLQLKDEESGLLHFGTQINHEIDVIEQKFDDALNRIDNYKSNILGDLTNFDINSIVADTISFINSYKSLNKDAINIFVNSYSAFEGLSPLVDKYRGNNISFANRNKDRVMGYLSDVDQSAIISGDFPSLNFIDDDSILRNSIRDFSNMVSINTSSINSLNIHTISGGTKGIMMKMFDKAEGYSKCLKIERDKYVYSLDFSFKINSKDYPLKIYDENDNNIANLQFSNFTKRFYGTICIKDDLLETIDVSYILKSSDNGKFEPSIKLGLKYDADFIYLYVEDVCIDTFYAKNSEIHDILDFSYSGQITSGEGLLPHYNDFGHDGSIVSIPQDAILKFVVDTNLYASFRDNSITMRDSFEIIDYSLISSIDRSINFDIVTVKNTSMKLKNSRLTDGNNIRITSKESTKISLSNVELSNSKLNRKYTIKELISKNDEFIKSFCKADNDVSCYRSVISIYSKVDTNGDLNTLKIPDYTIREIGKCGIYSGNVVFYMRSNLEYSDMTDYVISKSKDLNILGRTVIPFSYDTIDVNGVVSSASIDNALSMSVNNVNTQPTGNSALSINGTFFEIPEDFAGIVTIETEVIGNFEFDELTVKHITKADPENLFGSVVKSYDNQTTLFNQASISVDDFTYWNVKINGDNIVVFPKNEFPIIDGGNIDVKIQVELGYSIKSISVNGVLKPVSDSIYLENVRSNIVIDIVTEVDVVTTYQVTASIINGVIENFVTRYVIPGQSLTYKIIPDAGYYLTSVYVNDVPLDNSKINFNTNLFILENISSNIHITSTLDAIPKDKYDLTVGVSDIFMINSISEPTGLSVDRLTEDSSIEITLDPKFGNAVKNVSINGTLYTASSGNITLLTNRLIISDIKMSYNIIFNIEVIPLTPFTVTTFSGNGYNVEVGEFIIPKDGSKTFNIQVLEGYKPEYSVKVHFADGFVNLTDGADISNVKYGRITRQGNTIIFNNVGKDYTMPDTNLYLEIVCIKKTYDITIPTIPNGTIVPSSHTLTSGKITVEHGDTVELNIIPNAGYMLDTVTINGNTQTITDGSIVIPNVTSVITVSATVKVVEPEERYISVNAVNCTIIESTKGQGSFEVDEGSNLSFQISSIDKYRYDSISVTGGSYTFNESTKTITIINVRANYNITVSYVTKVFTVNSENNDGCIISPLGNTAVEYGNNLNFTTTLELGYRLTGYLIDGSVNIPTSSLSYTLSNITTNKSILPICEKVPVRLSIVSGSPTSHAISPSNEYFDRFYGESSPELTITPAVNKYVKTVKLLRPDDSLIRVVYSNNTPVNEDIPISGKLVKVTIENIIENCKLLVETDDVAIVNYTITVSGNGIGTNNGAHTVRHNTTFSASFSPSPGNRMTSIVFSNRTRVDFVGGRTTPYPFDFTSVVSNETVTVNQEAIPIPKRRILLIDESSATQKHTITINGQASNVKDIMIDQGTTVVLTITPVFTHLDYHKMESVKITNTIDGSGPTFSDVSLGTSWGAKTYSFVVGTHDLYRVEATSSRINYTIYPDSVINGTTNLVETTRHYNLVDYYSFTITPNANYELDHVTMYHQYDVNRKYSTNPANVGSSGTLIDSTNTRDVYMVGNTIYYKNSSQFRVTIAFKEKLKFNVKLFTNPNMTWVDENNANITSGSLGVHTYNSVNYDCRIIPVYQGSSFYAKVKYNTGYTKDHVTSTKGLFTMASNGNPKGTQLASATIANTFSNINGDVGLSIDTRLITYTISAGTLTNGTVTGTGTANHGTSRSVVFTPNSGYRIASITKNGTAMTGINSSGHTDSLTNITANVTYVVVFEVSTLAITFSSSGVDYSIRNSSNALVTGTTVNVTSGSDYNFRVAVSENKAILNVRLNINGTNIDLGSVSDYTLKNITSNITVTVTTDDKLMYDLQYLASKTYSISDGLVIKKGSDGRYWLYRINTNGITGIDPETNYDSILSGTTTHTYTRIAPMIPHNISTGIYTATATNAGGVGVNFNFNTASVSPGSNTQYVVYQYADSIRYSVFHIVNGVLGVYRARYWTRETPQVGTVVSADWERILTPNYKYTSNYVAGSSYQYGDTVFYNGVWYTANFWTTKDPSVWNNLKLGTGADWTVKGSPATWSSTVTYYTGNLVIRHIGAETYVFTANKTSINKDPNILENVSGDTSKEWRMVGRLV